MRIEIREGPVRSGRFGETDADLPALTVGSTPNHLATAGGHSRSLETEAHLDTGRNRLPRASLEGSIEDREFDQFVHDTEAITIEMEGRGSSIDTRSRGGAEGGGDVT